MHTPGPWKSQGWVPTWAHIPIHGPGGRPLASFYPDMRIEGSYKQAEADARLAATAPELLEALELAEKCMRNGYTSEDALAIRAAIAKARGTP